MTNGLLFVHTNLHALRLPQIWCANAPGCIVRTRKNVSNRSTSQIGRYPELCAKFHLGAEQNKLYTIRGIPPQIDSRASLQGNILPIQR